MENFTLDTNTMNLTLTAQFTFLMHSVFLSTRTSMATVSERSNTHSHAGFLFFSNLLNEVETTFSLPYLSYEDCIDNEITDGSDRSSSSSLYQEEQQGSERDYVSESFKVSDTTKIFWSGHFIQWFQHHLREQEDDLENDVNSKLCKGRHFGGFDSYLERFRLTTDDWESGPHSHQITQSSGSFCSWLTWKLVLYSFFVSAFAFLAICYHRNVPFKSCLSAISKIGGAIEICRSNFSSQNSKWKWFEMMVILLLASCGETHVYLQADDIARADSGLTWRKTLPSLQTFTFCVRIYSYRARYSDYFFSYATNSSDNELAFHLKYDVKQLRLSCCSRRVYQSINVDVKLLKWFSFCSAVDLPSLSVTFVHTFGVSELKLVDTQKDSPNPLLVNGGGIVILGQDQDEPGGGTDSKQSFNGLMTDLYLTRKVLTKEEMSGYIQCNTNLIASYTPLMDFNNVSIDFVLGASTEEKYAQHSCPAKNKIYSIFPEARNFKEANHFCTTLNGQVALPEDDVDNLALYDEGSTSSDKCAAFEKSSGMWVAVIWDLKQRVWQNFHRKKAADYKNFAVELTPNTEQPLCVLAKTLAEAPEMTKDGNWDLELCDRTVCTACQFDESKPLKIRGLCAESIFDRLYYIYDRINGRPVFNGFRWTKIAWNNTFSAYDYTWILYQIAEPSVQAKMVRKSELDYPIGVHDFEVVGDKCSGRNIKLKLTSCPAGMYTCTDGACIDISKRCDLELDCADSGDELNCDTVVLPLGYDKRLPPPKVDSSTPAQISIDFIIRLIRKFSLLDSHLVIDCLITRSWYDSRVRYKNLHDSRNLNIIDDIVEVIWFPEVTLLGADNSIANYELLSTTGWGQRLASPEPDDDQLLDEDVFYSGNQNLLVLEREITVTLMCTFDLTMYPFDSQRCTLKFYVGDYTQHYVSTFLNKVEFSGTRRLLEYQVTSIEHESLLYQNKSGQQIQIGLTNLYGYYISGAYIPTLLLLIISYSTFYFSMEDFTNRIMVSLTSLLVLASLFSQIASGLPKTAYMKLIDVWFIFCILSDFVIVMLLVLINTLQDKRSSVSKIEFVTPNGFPKKEPRIIRWTKLDPKLYNKIALIVLPSFIGLFIIVYFGGVAHSLNQVKDTF